MAFGLSTHLISCSGSAAPTGHVQRRAEDAAQDEPSNAAERDPGGLVMCLSSILMPLRWGGYLTCYMLYQTGLFAGVVPVHGSLSRALSDAWKSLPIQIQPTWALLDLAVKTGN